MRADGPVPPGSPVVSDCPSTPTIEYFVEEGVKSPVSSIAESIVGDLYPEGWCDPGIVPNIVITPAPDEPSYICIDLWQRAWELS